MMQIESNLTQLRLHGMSRSWKALAETRKAHELTFAEGLEILIQAGLMGQSMALTGN